MLTLNANVTFFTVNVNGSSNPSLPLPTFQASTHISVSIKPKPGFPIHTFPFPSPRGFPFPSTHSHPHIPIHTFPFPPGFPIPFHTHITGEICGLAPQRGCRPRPRHACGGWRIAPNRRRGGGGAETTKINSTTTLPNWVKPLKHRVRATGAHAVGKRKQRVCNGGSNAYATEEATRMQRKPKLAKTP